MSTRKKNRRRKRRTKKGGHATECETKKTIEMMRKIREAMEENRLKPCLKPSFKSAANKVKMANLAIKPEQQTVGDFFANAEKDASSARAKSNFKRLGSKVKMENLIKNQFKEHPEHDSSKGADNWHGWVARLDEREKSPNKGNTYYYKDGNATTWDAPKKDWVKIHEPQGGFYYWCTGNDKTTRTFPNKGTCLPPRPTSPAPLPPQKQETKQVNCGKYSRFDCNTVKGCELESFEEFKARKKEGKKSGKNIKKMKKKCVSSTRKGGNKRKKRKTMKFGGDNIFKNQVKQRNVRRQVGLASPDKCNKYTSIVSSKNLSERRKKVLVKALERDGCLSQLKSLGPVIQTDEEGQYVELGGRRKRRRRKTKKRKSKKRRRTKRKRN